MWPMARRGPVGARDPVIVVSGSSAARPEPVSDSDLDAVATAVQPVAERFGREGYRLFLVGGVVRDLVVASDRGEPLAGNDIDLTTDARPAEIKRLIDPLADVVWDQGERFGTIGAKIRGRSLEITTHRAEAYDPESRKPVVSFGDDIADDLARRDFTINAAAIELPGGELHDPYGGLSDLRQRLLRTPLSPEISFTDDPLRMLRAARFIPRFELTPDPELTRAATELAPRLDIVSVERVADELERLLAVAEPRAGFDFLTETGLLGHVVPGLGSVGGDGIDQAVALASAPVEPGPGTVLVRRAGLLWPLRAQAADELGRLRYSRSETTRTARLLDAVGDGLASAPAAPMVRRMVGQVGPDGLLAVATLAANLAMVGLTSRERVVELVGVIEHLRRTEDLTDLAGPLTGAEVMELLEIGPGPQVGRALSALKTMRIDEGPMSADQARIRLREWWEAGSDQG